MTRGKMPKNPWLPETTPVKLTVPAKKLPQWGLVRNGHMADEVPESPAKSDQPLEQVTLVPFGAQTLRITAFPLLRGESVPDPGLTFSHRNGNDGTDEILSNPAPSSSRGEGIRRMTFWDHTGTAEWLEWTFDKPEKVSSISVYWFDDSGSGRCRVPASWKLLAKQDGEWKPVANPSGFGVEKDKVNAVKFDEIETNALRIEVQLQEGFSGGILQLKRE